jgi:hypothetical protein
VIGNIIDSATNAMIREMKVPDVQDLEDLFKKALRELGVPVSIHSIAAIQLDRGSWIPIAAKPSTTNTLVNLINPGVQLQVTRSLGDSCICSLTHAFVHSLHV